MLMPMLIHITLDDVFAAMPLPSRQITLHDAYAMPLMLMSSAMLMPPLSRNITLINGSISRRLPYAPSSYRCYAPPLMPAR